MTVSHEQGVSSQQGGVERRTHPHLREIFDQAYDLAFPLLDPSQSGSSHFLRIKLHDAFPFLHQQDVAILSVSVERVFRERSKSAAL